MKILDVDDFSYHLSFPPSSSLGRFVVDVHAQPYSIEPLSTASTSLSLSLWVSDLPLFVLASIHAVLQLHKEAKDARILLLLP